MKMNLLAIIEDTFLNLFYERIKLRLQTYLQKGAVLLGQHHQITFGNILVTKGCNAKVRVS